MNAKSDGPRADASLPDRVEAARRYLGDDVPEDKLVRAVAMASAMYDAPVAEDHNLDLEDCMDLALAAADACEAERNPNTTDEPFVVDVDDEVSERGEPTRHGWWHAFMYRRSWARLNCPVCTDTRRPVSSEDVHREKET